MSSLFQLAIVTGKVDSVLLLLAGGADPNEFDGFGRTPLIVAATRGRSEIVHILIAHGADPLLPDKQGRKPCDHARVRGFAELATVIETFHRLRPDGALIPETAPTTTNLVDQYTHLSTEEVEPASPAGGEPAQKVAAVRMRLEATLDREPSMGEEVDEVSGWEAEAEALVPVNDGLRTLAAIAVQIDISRQQPCTADRDWSDVSVSLPRRLERRPRPLHPLIAKLLEEGLSEGSVTGLAVSQVSARTCRSVEERRHLRSAITDLGIAIEASPLELGLRGDDKERAYLGDFADELMAVALYLDDESDGALSPNRIYTRGP